MLSKPAKTVRRARSLRRNMTLPEVLLWQALRARPGGFRFRRQHPAGPFVMDFYCAEARLCIEVDGMAHDLGSNPVRDDRRNRLMAARGVETLRIPARDLLAELDAVLMWIVAVASARPLHHRALRGGPPPQM
jgi:very-short-patch-repair endonuclease